MSAKPEVAAGAVAPVKSKKMLIIVGALVLVLILTAVGAYIFISKRNAASAEDSDEPSKVHTASNDKPKTPPVYLPLDPMVVNLADLGGEKVAQVGITLEVVDAKASDTVKAYLPTIRSGVLLLISQRTSEELLKPEGKKKLSLDILKKAAVPFGGSEEGDEPTVATETKNKEPPQKRVAAQYPVVGVLFSSFIVQ